MLGQARGAKKGRGLADCVQNPSGAQNPCGTQMGNRLPATSTFFRLCVSLGLTYAWDRVNTSIHVYKNRIFKHVFSNTHFNSNNVSHIKAIN